MSEFAHWPRQFSMNRVWQLRATIAVTGRSAFTGKLRSAGCSAYRGPASHCQSPDSVTVGGDTIKKLSPAAQKAQPLRRETTAEAWG